MESQLYRRPGELALLCEEEGERMTLPWLDLVYCGTTWRLISVLPAATDVERKRLNSDETQIGRRRPQCVP